VPPPSLADAQTWNISFSQNAAKDCWLLERLRLEILPRLDPQRRLRILDLGCGCGATTFLLAALAPQAEVVGLDISEASIASAQRELAARQGDRVSFVCGDYRKILFPPSHFDLIVADGVLHLIPDAACGVISKIAGDLAPSGLFVFSVPRDGLFNRSLWLVRSMLRRSRSATTDRLIVAMAKLLHGDRVAEDYLRERVHYMYLTPTLWITDRLRAALRETHGLVPVFERPYPQASLGQFQLRLCAYTKPAAAASILRHVA